MALISNIIKSTLLLCCLQVGYIFASDSVDVYIINYSYHTGVIIPTDSLVLSELNVGENFKEYRKIDIGWGDADFYQITGFDLYLGAKALLMPTSSVLRFEGMNYPVTSMPENFDFIVLLKFSRERFAKMIELVNQSFDLDDYGKIQKASEQYSGKVQFYFSNEKYHTFNTCNTWVARLLRDSGFDISTFMVITKYDLYTRLKKIGKLIKALN
ncbi:MAG: DUF2459 domain-containing protein [Candidatus Kapabacteria bacterium]|nr:DUF2459 domain-containing protein [Candidatus Kapabacteria bacterium]